MCYSNCRIINQKEKADKEELLKVEASAPVPDHTKPKSKGISFGKAMVFTNSANSAEFPSLDEASKRNFVSKKEDTKKENTKKEAPKKSSEEEDAFSRLSAYKFTDARKGQDKPTFKELERQRESSGKGELTSDPYKDRSREFMVSTINKCRWLAKIRNIRIIQRSDTQKRGEIIGIMIDQRRVIGLGGKMKKSLK